MTRTPMMTLPARPRFFTPGTWVVAAIAALGAVVLLARFALGLGATTNLSDAYPWGIWIAIDVACGVALAAGGFTTAFLARLLGRREHHAVVRAALLTAVIGYTFVAMGVLTDLGRFWAIWHVLLPTMWQPNSVLLEVGLCVVTYLTVLYLEFLPIACERFIGRVHLPGPLARFNGAVDAVLRRLDSTLARIMTGLVILGVVLSCMHQSSLGTLMVIAGDKLHPLWQTPVLPMMFLLSAFAVGLSMVVFEGILAARAFGFAPERDVLGRLAAFIPVLLGIYLTAKVIDLAVRGAWVHVFEPSVASAAFGAEIVLGVLVPIAIFLDAHRRRAPRWLFAGSALVVLGVVLNRVDVFLVGYTPRGGGSYVPAWTEVAVTAGFIAMIVLAYRFVVLNFPVIEALPVTKSIVRSSPGRGTRHRALAIARPGPLLPLGAAGARGLPTIRRGRRRPYRPVAREHGVSAAPSVASNAWRGPRRADPRPVRRIVSRSDRIVRRA